MIIEISVAVIAAAFVILVIYLIVLIIGLKKTLKEVNITMSEARHQLNKAEAFNPLFNAISHTGQILEQQAADLKNNFFENEEEREKKKKTINNSLMASAAILELAGLGLSIWQKYNKGR